MHHAGPGARLQVARSVWAPDTLRMCATKPATGSPTAPRPPYGLARKEFRLSRRRHVDRGLIAQVGLAVMLGTGCQTAPPNPEAELRAELALVQGEGSRVEVTFLRDDRHLLLLIDSPEVRTLPDSAARAHAAAMAEVVSRQYLRAEALDSITVKLVEFLPGAGASWCARYTVTYGSRVEEGMFPPRLTRAHDGTGAGAEVCDLVIRGPRPDQPWATAGLTPTAPRTPAESAPPPAASDRRRPR